MYHVSAQSIDERMINVHYCYYYYLFCLVCVSVLKLVGKQIRLITDGTGTSAAPTADST